MPFKAAMLCAGLLCAAASGGAAAPALTDFGQGTQVGRVTSAQDLTGAARKLYRQFTREARYFGAFAAHPVTGQAFYVVNFHDTQKARRAALEGCAQLAEAAGCQLVGIAMPESLPIDRTNASGMSEEASDAFATVYQENRRPGAYAAFAISGSSHFGYANAWDTADVAKDTALAYCERGVARDMVEIGPKGRDYARARGLNECKVVHVELAVE